MRSLWTLATTAVTVFGVFLNGTTESIKPWFGACKGIKRKQFQTWMEPVRTQFEACLQAGSTAGIKEWFASRADILEHKEAL